jgi:hypothetical protein
MITRNHVKEMIKYGLKFRFANSFKKLILLGFLRFNHLFCPKNDQTVGHNLG